MPLVELMESPRAINVSRNLVIKHNGTALVIAGRQKLYKLPPVLLVARDAIIASVCVKRRDCIVFQKVQAQLIEVFATKVVYSKISRMDFVHS